MWQLLVLNEGTWEDILPRSNNLTWTSNKDNLAVELSFDSMYYLTIGSYVSLMKDGKEIFRTILVKSNEKRNTFSYNCYDYMWYLNKSKLLMQFNDIAASDAIKQMCDREDIKSNIAPMTTKIKKVYKQEISSIIEDILKQVEEETGDEYIKYMDINVFTIAKVTEMFIMPKFLIGGELNITQSMEEMKNSIVVTCNEKLVNAKASGKGRKTKKQKAVSTAKVVLDENGNLKQIGEAPAVSSKGSSSSGKKGRKATTRRISSETSDEDNIAKYGLLQEIIEVDEKNYSQALNTAQNKLDKLNRIANEINVPIVVVEGGEQIVANRFIPISIPEKGLDGWYQVKSANHQLTNGLHKVNLVLEVVD